MGTATSLTRKIATTLFLGICGCASGPFAEETVGERFRKVLAQIDQNCREMKIGPYLDPSDPDYRNKRRATDCDILKLEPRDWRTEKMVQTEGQHYPVPERWLATPEGRFAHSIRLPAPHDKPKAVYRSGMSGQEYFEALCKEEAGEFVFERVIGVERVFEFRPRREARSEEFFHLFALEDPYGYVHGETEDSIGALWTSGSRYDAIERRKPGAAGYEMRFRIRKDEVRAQVVEVPSSTARYGFIWRGVTRPGDREHGVAGGELIAIDRTTNLVLGFRRGFTATGVGNKGASWEFSPVCPRQNFRGGRSKDFDFGLWFLSDVLRPRGYESYRSEILGAPSNR